MDPSQRLHQRFSDAAVTYGLLDTHSGRLAAALRLCGVRADDRLGTLGILEAGADAAGQLACLPRLAWPERFRGVQT